MKEDQPRKVVIEGIPALIWGPASDQVYIYVHGKIANKEAAKTLAGVALQRGWQVLSFDLPSHGERSDNDERCDVWTGMRDLKTIARYTHATWHHVGLYAVSIGAYFSLMSYQNMPFKQVFFQSPIVDMEWLITQMFQWFGVSEEDLRKRGEIPTPVETLSWDYLQFVRAHPIERWPHPTSVLYAGHDTLQSREVIREFCSAFNCSLTVSKQSDHPFQAPGDQAIIQQWISEKILSA